MPEIINIKNEVGTFAVDEILKFIERWKTDAHIPLISEWAEQNRYMPVGQTELPGKIDHSIAPHLIEIQDNFHPDSGIKQTTIMKGTQSLLTTTLENVMGHSIRYKLHNILFIISSKAIAKIRSSAAIDPLIDNSGLAEYMKPISTRLKRKIADSTFYKEMHGGRRLMLTSWNSIADAKSLSWDLIIMDEIDEAPYELKGQGDPEAIFAGRGKTIRDLKIAKISTPTNTTGRVYKNFLEGDQRYYNCACPHCGEKQVLKIKAGGRDYGLTAKSETIDSVAQVIPETVRYLCKFCQKDIYEFQKGYMLQNGVWIPNARPVDPGYRSYHVSNLMSPIMFYSWEQVMQEFAKTKYGGDITRFKNFTIDVLGEPWEARSDKKNWTELFDRAEKYPLGEIPQGGLIVCGGADIQMDRIELQCVAYGIDMDSWVIDYQTFWGDTKNKNNKVWLDFANYLKTKKYKFKNTELKISLTAIDSGYNPKASKEDSRNGITTEHTVYEFVARTSFTIASRGNDKLKDRVLKQERVHRKSPLKVRYDLAVSELKDEIFIKLDLPIGSQGYIHFPDSLPKDYFQGFASEVFAETKPGQWSWKKIYERNEPLDTYILTRGAAEYLNLPTLTIDNWIEYEKQILN